MKSPTARLTVFAAGRRFEDFPELMMCWAEDRLVDWFGCTVAGHGSGPVACIARFARAMGPQAGAGTPMVGNLLCQRQVGPVHV